MAYRKLPVVKPPEVSCKNGTWVTYGKYLVWCNEVVGIKPIEWGLFLDIYKVWVACNKSKRSMPVRLTGHTLWLTTFVRWNSYKSYVYKLGKLGQTPVSEDEWLHSIQERAAISLPRPLNVPQKEWKAYLQYARYLRRYRGVFHSYTQWKAWQLDPSLKPVFQRVNASKPKPPAKPREPKAQKPVAIKEPKPPKEWKPKEWKPKPPKEPKPAKPPKEKPVKKLHEIGRLKELPDDWIEVNGGKMPYNLYIKLKRKGLL